MPKKFQRKKAQEPEVPRTSWRRCLPLFSALAIGVGICWPQVNYQAARTVQIWNQDVAERLCESAVVWSGGDYPAAQVLRARLLLLADRPEEAIGSWLTIPDPSRCSSSQLIGLADEALSAGQMRFALDVAARAGEASPQDPELLRILSTGNASLGDFQKALDASSEWVERVPMSALAWVCHTENLRGLRRVMEAIDTGQHALTLEISRDDELQVRRALSELYLSRSDAASAKIHCEWVLRNAEPLRIMDHVRMGYVYRLMCEWDDVHASIARALSMPDPDVHAMSQAIMLRGLVFSDQGNHELAADDFREVLRRNSQHKEAAYKLARSLLAIGRTVDAQKYLDRSKSLQERFR